MPVALVATWDKGLFVIADGRTDHELPGQAVKSLASDGRGNALVVLGSARLASRSADGTWKPLARAAHEMACCVAVRNKIYVGTDDAQVMRFRDNGSFEQLLTFGSVSGRDTWYAGTAVVDGQVVGPPLGVRSMTATCDGVALLANVHVGGIPRSDDGGVTWQPTIDIESDVHQVCAHPTRPEIVAAAAAVGLCLSRDAGKTWAVERRGLHAPHCSAVAFVSSEVFVSASVDPFSAQGAVYRRALDDGGPLRRVDAGLPRWLEGKTDTGCIAAKGSAAAMTDQSGNLYVSEDAGRTWTQHAKRLGAPSSVFIY